MTSARHFQPNSRRHNDARDRSDSVLDSVVAQDRARPRSQDADD
jgi:hypothetical protein